MLMCSIDIDDPGQRGSGEEGDSSDEEFIPYLHLQYVLLIVCISSKKIIMYKSTYMYYDICSLE